MRASTGPGLILSSAEQEAAIRLELKLILLKEIIKINPIRKINTDTSKIPRLGTRGYISCLIP